MSNWRVSASCRSVDPELFFPVGVTGPAVEQVAAAKRVCARCPVRDECLGYALSAPVLHGVLGGLTAEERAQLTRRVFAQFG